MGPLAYYMADDFFIPNPPLWTVNHAPESPSKYMTAIYHYFCIKNEYFLDFFKVKNAPSCTIQKYFLGEACPPNSQANAWPRHASQDASRHAIRPAPKKVGSSLANPAYAHGLLPRNLFEKMRS